MAESNEQTDPVAYIFRGSVAVFCGLLLNVSYSLASISEICNFKLLESDAPMVVMVANLLLVVGITSIIIGIRQTPAEAVDRLMAFVLLVGDQ